MFAERYANCSNTGGYPIYTSLWCDSSTYWRSVFCINNLQRTPAAAGYPACAKFQVSPAWETGCDGSLAQSGHPTGMNVCLADGSVRFVVDSMDATVWANVCDPRDGATVIGDW
jgi:prepilin-type processing-associated H-X9-DG protein